MEKIGGTSITVAAVHLKGQMVKRGNGGREVAAGKWGSFIT